jgi:hypothetical protein
LGVKVTDGLNVLVRDGTGLGRLVSFGVVQAASKMNEIVITGKKNILTNI